MSSFLASCERHLLSETRAIIKQALGVAPSWVYKRTKKGCADPLPVVRLGARAIRFDPYKVFLYVRARERHRPDATLESSDGIARVSGKAFTLARKRFQTGSVRLREDRGPAYWQGFYREDVVNEAGKTERKRIAVTLGFKFYAHVLDASADAAAETLSGRLSGSFSAA